jgi:hypothetical protein
MKTKGKEIIDINFNTQRPNSVILSNQIFFMKFLPLTVFVFLFLGSTLLYSQQPTFISGTVLEVEGNTPLPGANIYWESEPQKGVVSDINGEFTLASVPLPAKLVISFIGYSPSIRVLTVRDLDKPLRFFLKPEELSLEEIIIRETNPEQNVKGIEMGKSVVPIETIKNIPALFGEVDILRSLQLLPGVKSAGEGTTGLFVRGGSADQNLINLDGAPVYNPSHFFGFFSVFNPDALSDIEFYKGNIPAELGGRVSSVIDVSMREGNFQKIRGEGGIGTISSRLTLDGPLFSDKSSFVVSGRRTYADLFLRLSNNENIKNNQLYFYDLSAKFTFKLGEKDKISFSSYYGSDFLGLSGQFGLGWNNFITSFNWNRNISSTKFFDLSAYHSRYQYQVLFDDPQDGFNWTNSLSESGVNLGWTWLLGNNSVIKAGYHGQLYYFAPINLELAPESNLTDINTNQKNGLLNNLYVSGTTELGSKLLVEAGLRLSHYQEVGKGVLYQYENGIPSPDAEVTDTLTFGRLERMKAFQRLEPRISLRYLIAEDLSFKAAFNRNHQYVQVASNSSAGLPIDRWVPSGTYIEPLRGDQVSVGLFKNFAGGTWEVSVETYYKDFRNVIDLRQGASVLFTDNVETELLSGVGYAYGTEFLIRKNVGKTTGWLGYTYSRTWRKIEGISSDTWYNPRFDRPHDVSLVLNHEFSDRWSAGLTFVYTSGQAVTFPVGTYVVDTQRVPVYGDQRNADRFPDYHRVDASITWKNQDKGRKWRGSWNFSVYNLYGRKNPFTFQFTDIYNDDITFDPEDGGEVVSQRPGVIMTYLFTFLPALTYNFKF